MISDMSDTLVQISRFGEGDANKIFDEVNESGIKIVVKNNIPACVLLKPERYKEIMEIAEDQYLFSLAEERLKNDDGAVYTFEETLAINAIKT